MFEIIVLGASENAYNTNYTTRRPKSVIQVSEAKELLTLGQKWRVLWDIIQTQRQSEFSSKKSAIDRYRTRASWVTALNIQFTNRLANS